MIYNNIKVNYLSYIIYLYKIVLCLSVIPITKYKELISTLLSAYIQSNRQTLRLARFPRL